MSQFTDDLAQIGRSTITEEEPRSIRDRDPITRTAVDLGQRLVGLGESVDDRLVGEPEVGPAEQFEIDKQTLPPGQFALKYGLEAERARFFESDSTTTDLGRRAAKRQDSRPLYQKASDITAGAVSAGTRITADTLAFGIRSVPGGEAARQGAEALGAAAGLDTEVPRLDEEISDLGRLAGDFIANQKSERAEQLRAGQARDAAARLADSEAEYQQSDKSLREQFRRIGRDAIITADSYRENPSAAVDVAAEGLGSMIPSLATAGTARGLATAALKRLGVKGLGKEAVETVVTAATVGAMEGSGAYGETRNAVLELDEATLNESSEDYRALREGGMSHEEARENIARVAAMEAQVKTSLVAAGISLPFAGFEGGAFTRGFRGIKGVADDVVGQTVEEAAQNSTAQAFQNIAVRDNADASVDFSDDVGQSATEGAIGGLGATAALSSPQLPKLYIEAMGETLNKMKAGGVLIGKGIVAGKVAKNKREALNEIVATVDPQIKQAEELLDMFSALDDPKQEVSPEARELLTRVRDNLAPEIARFSDDTSKEFKERTKPFKAEIVPGQKLKTLSNVAQAILDGKYDDNPETAEAISEYLNEQKEALADFMFAMEYIAEQQAPATEETPSTQRTPEEEAQAQAQARARAEEFVSGIDETPVFSQSLKAASETLNEASNRSVAAGTGVKPVRSVAEVVMNPVGVDPNRITDEVKAEMSADSLKAVAVVEAIQAPEHSDRLDPVQGNRKNDRAGARRETLFQSKTASFGEIASFNDMVSQLIRGAIRNGREGSTVVRDTAGAEVDAKDVLTDLQKLIQHQQNKYDAATESYNFSVANPDIKKTDRKFDSLSQRTGEFQPGKGSIYVYAPSPNSIQTYAAIAEDLNTGIRAYNALLEQFPETYQGEPLQEVAVPTVPKTQSEATQDGQTLPETAASQEAGTNPDPTQVVSNPGVDNDTSSPGDSLQPSGKLNFAELFQGGTETNLSGAIRYLLGSDALNPQQQTLLAMIAGSSFARANPRTIVRQPTAEERAAAKSTHGWWDPQQNEIVIFEETAPALLHEMIHAVTLEALFQNLASASLKRGTEEPLTATEKAALELNDAAIQFMEQTNVSPQTAAVQGIMRALIDPSLPLDQQDRGMARAISEYMAYGLTVKEVQQDLDKIEYVDPSLAQKVIGLVKGIIGAFIGESNPTRNSRNAQTALDRLYFNTRTLALDSQGVALQAREVQRAQAQDVTQGTETEATPETPAREAPAETTPEAPAPTTAPESTTPVESQPAQAEEQSPEETGSDATLPAADETESAITAAIAAIADGVGEAVGQAIEQRLPTPEPAPTQTEQVSEATPTPETTTADAVETTGAENASETSSAEPVQAPAGLEDIGTTRAVDQDVGLPDGWTPDYVLGTTLLSNGDNPSFLGQLLTKLEPKLQPGDTLDRLITAAEDDLSYEVDADMRKANDKVRADAFRMVQGMQARLTAQIKKLKAKNGKPLLEALQAYQNGETDFNPARSEQYRLLAWLDADSIRNGEPKIDQHLLMLAMMAAADYVMNNENSGGKYKLDDIKKILGINDVTKITPEMIDMVNSGRPGVYVKPALANHIRQFMGATLNDNMSPTETEGAFEALSHEILEYLSLEGQNAVGENFWFKQRSEQMPGGRTVTAYSFGNPNGWQGDVGKNLLRDVLTSKSSDMHRYSIGQKWADSDLDRTVKKDRSLRISKEQRAAMKKQQDTPFYFSKDFWEMYDTLGAQAMAYMLGFRSLANGEFYNAFDEKAVEGKNASVKYGINNTIRQIEEIRAYAEKNGIDPHEVPVYYRISIGTNTRFNFEGFNPQQNKFVREMFSPTRHTINPQDTKQVDIVYAAIGQSLGLKVEDLGIQEAANQAREELAGRYAPVMEALRSGNLGDPKIRATLVRLMNEDGRLEEDAFTLKGLWTAMKLEQALAGGATSFETDMYMELDGKTNGPISAAIQHFGGTYSKEILATWRRGGYFLSNAFSPNDGISYHQWKNSINVDNEAITPDALRSDADFYGRVGELMGTSITDLMATVLDGSIFQGKPRDGAQQAQWVKDGVRAFNMTMGLLNKFDGYDVVQGEDRRPVIRIKRGATKSPITQNLYGAQALSISQGLAGDMMADIYSDLSKAGQGDQKALARLREIAPIIDNLMTHEVVRNEFGEIDSVRRSATDGRTLSSILQAKTPSKELMRDFQFTGSQADRLTGALRAFYVPAFEAALEVAVDPSVAQLNKSLIEGSQLQGKIYKNTVEAALEARRQELVEDGTILANHELPRAEVRKIFAEHRDLAPIIDNGLTSFSTITGDTETSTQVANRIYGQKKAQSEGKEVAVEAYFNPRSRTLSGKQIDSRRDIIGDSGVRVLPFTTQTNSDVAMEIRTWNHPDYPSNALAVHDGNNQATNTLEAASRVMNEAIANAWQTNTLRPILESYDRALAFLELGTENQADLEAKGVADQHAELKALRDALEIDVLRRDARIEAEKQVFTSYQGVPGADAPFVQEGQRFANDDQLIDFLNYETNRIWIEKLSELTVEKNQEGLEARVSGDLRDLNVSQGTFNGEQIVDVLSEAIAADSNLRDIVTAAFQAPVLGQLIEQGLKIELNDLGEGLPSSAGVYNPETKVVYLNVANSEVVAHEMVHVATVHQIYDYYVNGNTTPELDEAFESLERDLDAFLDQDLSANPTLAAVGSVIKGYQLQNNIAAAMAEFIAYGTTNQTTMDNVLAGFDQSAAGKIQRIFQKALNTIRKLLGMRAKEYNQVKTWTKVIMRSVPHSTEVSSPTLAHSIFGDTLPGAEAQRKLRIQRKIGEQVTQFLKARLRGDDDLATRAKQTRAAAEYTKAKTDALDALSTAAAAGFTIDGTQDKLLFQTLHAVMSADTKLDTVALQELNEIYGQIMAKLTPQMFEKFGPGGQANELQGQRMFAALIGIPFYDLSGNTQFNPVTNDKGGQKLAMFLALAQTSPELREILQEIDLADLNLNTDIEVGSGLDGLLGSTTQRVINRLNGRIIESNGDKSLPGNEAIDVLTEMLLEYDAQAATDFENDRATNLKGMNVIVGRAVSDAARRVGDGLRESAEKSSNDLSKMVQGIGAGLADILVENRAQQQDQRLIGFLNRPEVPETLRALYAEIRSIGSDNAEVLQLVKKAKNAVSRLRQEYIEQVPKIIRSRFGEGFQNLKEAEQRKIMKALYKGMGQADFGIVAKVMGINTGLELFGSTKEAQRRRDSAIRDVKREIERQAQNMGVSDQVIQAYYKKADQLAEYMINKNTGVNLLKSAVGILNLHNEDGLSISKKDYAALQAALKARRNGQGRISTETRTLIDNIDLLASLEAISKLDDDTQSTIADLVKTDKDALQYAADYQRELHRLERAKVDINSSAAVNGVKGHFITQGRRKYSVILANTSDEQKLREQGYKRIRDYDSAVSQLDPSRKGQSYYFSAHNKLATYNQGVVQTVQDTYSGVDPVTGMMIGPETTGELISGKEAKLLNQRLKARTGLDHTDGLIPVFDMNGELLGFEQAVASDMLPMLEQTQDYADSLGRWAGRIQEEQAAQGLNKELIDAMKATYDRDAANGRADEYADFGHEQKDDGSWDLTGDLAGDPVWREAYFLMPKAAREYAEEVFGGPIKVRRDLINNTFGFRSASVADIWTGKSRLNDELRAGIREIFMATPFLGQDAFKYVTGAEELLQQAVAEVKHVIVVKSGVILVANTLANVIQLATREVPISYMTQRTRSKFAEIETYLKNEDLKIKLRADALASRSKTEQKNIEARIEAIDEANRKMSIWPLLEANQFTTISEGLTDSDRALMDGRFMDWVEKKAGELPGPLSTVARYGIVAKDTALYQGLAKGVQYGDFISKAIYYDFLTEERGVSPEDAMLKIDQEYINYDLNDSRARSYLESIGLTWFMNFKLRSIKIALDIIRNNPASALLALSTANVLNLDAGSPVLDNVASVAGDGRLGYSIGPGMVEAGWNLNPWVNLTS